MARERPYLFAMNGGMVSPLALGRTDLARMKLTAEIFRNAFPRVIGPMIFRGGLGYLGQTYSNGITRSLPFIFSVDDTALIELANNTARILIDGAPVTRLAVATVVTSGGFSNSTGWTLATTSGAIANINSTLPGQLAMQSAARGASASASQTLSVAAGDVGKEHALRVVVTQGEVQLRIGSTSGGQELFNEQTLAEGTHSLVFTPTSTSAFLKFSAQSEILVGVDSATIEAAGVLALPTPWATANLFELRTEQSADVTFVAIDSSQPMKIERRGNPHAWSIEKYKFMNGPFVGKTAKVNLTPSARLGNGVLTASGPFFQAGHVGALFQLTHTQTTVDVSLAGPDQYTDTVRVAGKDEGSVRAVVDSCTGTWVGTTTYEYSYDEGDNWEAAFSATVNNGTSTIKPGSDNTIVLVRKGFQSGDYISGVINIAMAQAGGGGTGVVRITSVTDSTHANYEVVSRLHYTGSTESWQEGKYSAVQGWPSSVALHEGRLCFGGKDQLACSASDDFTDFDVLATDASGDAGPIIKSVSTGPVNKVQWMVSLARLIIGTSGAETALRSSSLDEPVTPTNNSVKDVSTYGSGDVQGLKVDRNGIFIHRALKRLYEIAFSAADGDYMTTEITRYNPTVLAAGVKIMAVQRNPDTRIWCVLNDGTAGCLVYDRGEDVISWCTFETDGLIQDIAILPNVDADDVYMTVLRTIGGNPFYYREVLAYEDNAQGGTENYMADAYIIADVGATAVIPGLGHLIGESVVVWAAGTAIVDATGTPKQYVVSGAGTITLDAPVTGRVIAGLPYEGDWQSTKLAYASTSGTAMAQRKVVNKVSPIMNNTMLSGIQFGQTEDKLTSIPRIYKGRDIAVGTVMPEYDDDSFSLPGKWDTDARVYIKMQAPCPATVMGIVLEVDAHERA